MGSSVLTAADVRRHLDELNAELAAADLEGLHGNREYMDDLADEIASERAAYIGMAVTEIAILRGELSGRPQG